MLVCGNTQCAEPVAVAGAAVGVRLVLLSARLLNLDDNIPSSSLKLRAI